MAEFWIGSKVGRGPVGTSYEGMLKEGRRPVVVKVISKRFHEYPELLEAILDELRGWIGFEHNNVVSTRFVTTYQDRHAVLFDKAPGENLEEYLRERGPLEPRLALLVLRDVALALAVAHEGDVAIGDVRSAKIYFDGRRAQVADLGLHRASAMGAGFGRYGLAFGHPAYLAPEVLQEGLKDPTPQTDIYALGILFYELLTGAPPFEGEVRDLLRAHVEQPITPPPAIAANKSLQSLLARLTAKDPQYRLRTAAQVVDGLYKLVGAAPPPQQSVSLMSTGIWRRQATEDAQESSSEWSTDQIQNAQPVGPNLSSQTGRFSSARLPQTLMHSAELPAPEEAPSGSAAADGQVELVDGAPVDWEKIKLRNQIARGPCGSLYEAELAHYNKPVVVKVLSTKFAKGGADLRKRILGQVLKSVGLAGANAAGPVRVAHVDQRDLILFERVEGAKSLRQVLIERTRIPHEQALEWVIQLAGALRRGEARKLHHGDIRPEKVLIDSQGRARLADFGFAIASCLGSGYGQIGLHFGHPTYLAPEVVQTSQDQPSFVSDAYALGILFYELVSGYPPFQGETPKKTLVMHLQTPLPPPPKKARVPRVIAEMILQLATKDPTRRSQTGADMVAALQRCQKQVKLSGGKAEAAPPVEEFDPTSMGLDGTSGMWASVEADPGDTSDEWSAEKINEAEAVGPEGLDETMWNSEEFSPDSPFEF